MVLLAPSTVTAPPRVPYRFGLSSVLTFRPETDHWAMGAQWQSPACSDVGVTVDPCVDDRTPATKTAIACPVVQEAAPFTVYAYDRRPTVSISDDERAQWARDVLDAGEWSAVEDYVVTALESFIAANAANDLGDAGSPAEALGMVEAALASVYGGQGVVMADRVAVTLLAEAGLVTREGNRLTTALGTPIAALADATAHVVAARVNIYGTGALHGWRSDVMTHPALDTQVNRYSTVAERTYLIGWDCTAVMATAPVPA